MEIFNKINFIKCLGCDLYTTFLAELDNKDIVVKFYTEYSDINNEFEIMEILNQNFNKIFPIKPIIKITDIEISSIKLTNGEIYILKNVWQVIIYPFVNGYTTTIYSIKNIENFKQDILKQFSLMHDLGFVYGDLKLDNIIITDRGNYQLIDFGRSFHISNMKYPPIPYMIEYDEIPTQEDDIKTLEDILSKLA